LLYDFGSHLVDQALQFFGQAAQVYAELDIRRAGARTDDDTFVALMHESGVRSHLWMSAVAAEQGPRFRVLGSEAAFTKYGLDGQEDALLDGGDPREPGWGREPEEHWGELATGDEARRIETVPGAYQRFYERVVRALREGRAAAGRSRSGGGRAGGARRRGAGRPRAACRQDPRLSSPGRAARPPKKTADG
jgi:predicted dehydrogenase